MATKRAAKSAPATFRDRIVGLVWVAAARLKRHPENWRTHPERQREAFRGVLAEVGVAAAAVAFIGDDAARADMLALPGRDERAASLAVYKGKLTLIDGHLRKDEIAGQPIPTLVLDVTPEEARKALASHDAVTALAEVHAGRYRALAERACFDGATVRAALESSLARYAVALPPLPSAPGSAPAEDEQEPVIPTDALVAKWGTAPGQLWVVPSLTVPGREHRLLCGDCRDPANVERMRGGRRPVLGLHDGPYGISAVQNGGARHGRGRGWAARRAAFAEIIDDDRPFEPSHLLGSAAIVVLWGANNFADKLPPSAEWVVWQKLADDSAESSFSSAELAWVSPPSGRAGHVRRVVCTDRGGSGGYADGEKRLHPTQKPIKVQRAPVEWYSEPGDDVEDWYMGAGAVIIACEQTGRIGHGLDIAPAYLAATLERFAVRGLKPRLVP